MASLYKKNNTWYISVFVEGKRKTRSLRTNDKQVADKLKTQAEYEMLAELLGFKKKDKELDFKELSEMYLKQVSRATNTQLMYENVFKQHILGKPLPINPNSRSIHIRAINSCWNWGLKKGIVTKHNKIDMDTKGEARQRTYIKVELQLMFKYIEPDTFNHFVQFAYYTGARSGEIRSISIENIESEFITVAGKTGRRLIKMNSQAKKIIQAQTTLWDYRKDYVSHKFKKRGPQIRN